MIIGITGKAGAGKDAAAEFLVRDWGFVKVSLADPLKRLCRHAFGFSNEQLWGPSENRNAPDKRFPRQHTFSRGKVCLCCGTPEAKGWDVECFLTPRFALQQLGTEWGRSCYENVWVDYALKRAELMLGGKRHADTVNTDCYEFPFYEAQSDICWIIERDESAEMWPFGKATHWKHAAGVVIPDVRFPNELAAIRAAGGKVWRIERPPPTHEALRMAAQAEWRQHASETSLDDADAIDTTIINDGTLDDLRKAITAVLL